MAIKFSRDQVLKRIEFENPWWKTGKIDGFYARMRRREYFRLLYPLVVQRQVKRAVVLMGPRRVGKTVLLFHCIDELLNSGVPAKNICYFSIETPLYNGIALEELLNLYLSLNSVDKDHELYLFYDEIQYLKDWERHLKSLVDSYHNVKFMVSGSAAAALKLKSRESGAGRFTDFLLPPLTFQEFLALTKSEEELIEPGLLDHTYVARDIDKLNQKFLAYINFGGYPELSLSKELQSDPGRFIRHDIIDKVLLRDLPSLYGINDIQELNSLFTYLAYNTGNEMSLEGISQNSGVAKNTIRKYITYLEAAFLINIVHRIDQNGKRFKRANFFKVYLTNPSLRSALFAPVADDDEHLGNLVETAVFAQWQHSPNTSLYYARWKSGEVDIVHLGPTQKPQWCVEVKWSNRFVAKPHELKNLKLFCTKHKLPEAVVTTIDKTSIRLMDGFELDFTPASEYCYTVGKNAINQIDRHKSM